MKSMFIHIGHGKTGSSFLQSILALNSELLSASGLFYPAAPTNPAAANGKITSGNGRLLFENADYGSTDAGTVVFSGETLFRDLRQGKRADLLASLQQRYQVTICVYTRDVFEHSFSRWAQNVKRGGVSLDLNQYLIANPLGPWQLVRDWLRLSCEYGFNFVVRNYSRHKHDLLETFFYDLSGSDSIVSTLERPPNRTVNRSLSFSEFEIQRLFNMVEKKRSSLYISDAVVNELPDVESAQLRCSYEAYECVKDHNVGVVEELNASIPADEAVQVECSDEVCEADSSLVESISMEQLAVMSKGIKERLLTLDELDTIRDIAFRIAANSRDNADLEDAKNLISIVSEKRPNAPVVKAKLAEWSEKLKLKESD